jgi:hypothetical protein
MNPWAQDKADSVLHQQAQASDALRLAAHFDKNSPPHGQEAECSVLAERVGFLWPECPAEPSQNGKCLIVRSPTQAPAIRRAPTTTER